MDASLYSKAFTAFSFSAENNTVLSTDVEATIDGTNVSLIVPYGTDVTALIASFSTTGQFVTVGDTIQVSDETANDFTNPVTCNITAADGSTQDYTVSVTVGLTVSSVVPADKATYVAIDIMIS